MSGIASSYVTLLVVTTAILLALAFWVWRRRPAPGARTFVVLMLSMALWSATQALAAGNAALPAKIFWNKATFLSYVTMPIAWLAFVLRFIQQERQLTRRNTLLLAIEPLVVLLLVWTNEAHGLIWRRTWLDLSGPFPRLGVSFGLGFWMHIVYAYLLVSVGTLLLVQAWLRAPHLQRGPFAALLLSALIVWGGDIFSVSFPHLGAIPTALALPLAGLIVVWSLFHFRLFNLVPIARGTVMDNIDDAIIVIDVLERIVDLNLAAQRLVGQIASEVMWQPVAEVFSPYSQLIARYRDMAEVREELAVGEGDARRYFDLRLLPLHDRHGQPQGRLVMLHDVTARKQSEERLASLCQTALELTSQLNLPQLLQTIVERATELLHGSGGGMYLYRPEHDDLEYVAAYKITQSIIGQVLKRGEGLSGKVLESGQPMAVADYRTWPGRAPIYEGLPFGAAIGVPVKWGEQILGVINVLREAGASFSAEDTRLLTLFANQAAVAVANAQLYQAAQQELLKRKQAEEELYESKQRLEKTLYSLRDAVFILDAAGPTVVDCNPAASEIFGYRREEMVGKTTAFLHVDQAALEEFRRNLYPAIEEKGVLDKFEFRMKRKDGSAFPTEHSVMPLLDEKGERTGWVSVVRDITERKRTEEALRRRTEELAALQATVLDITAMHDQPTLLHTIVERAARLLHAPAGGLYLCDPVRQEVRCLVSYNTPRDYTGTVLKYGEGAAGLVAQTGQPLIIDDYRIWSGRAAVFEQDQPFTAVLSAPLVWQGQVTGVIHVLDNAETRRFTPADLELLNLFASHAAIAVENARLYEAAQQELAERKRVGEEVRRLKEFNENIVQSIAEGIIIDDADGYLTFVNAAAANLLGYKVEELIGQHWTSVVPPDQQPIVQAANERRAHGETDRYELEVVRPDGVRIPVLVAGSPRFEGGRFAGTLAVFTDLTERKRAEKEREKLEAQLRQAQKLEAVGLLAGGMAHEFNNRLTVILGNTELALSQIDPSHPLHKELSVIERTANQAAILIRQLLTFGRRQALQPRKLDLNVLITEFAKMLRPIIGEHIELRLDLASDVPALFADPGALEQALMNMALNARDAMPEGGTLAIETAPATLDEAFCHTRPQAKPGAYVRLSLVDTGVGMDEAILQHLFEPFFTTKEVGKGAGLGLSVVYGIVEQHGGFIEVESQVGQGTRFDLYLPAYQPSAEEGKGEAAPPVAVPRGTETILLAEDEPPVLELALTVLEGLGYAVLVATDGLEAVQAFTANRERIDLVILDAVMPKLSGLKAYEAMSALRPGLPVLFITGYAAEMVGLPSAGQAGWSVLQKPFSVSVLGRKVREALDARRNRRTEL